MTCRLVPTYNNCISVFCHKNINIILFYLLSFKLVISLIHKLIKLLVHITTVFVIGMPANHKYINYLNPQFLKRLCLMPHIAVSHLHTPLSLNVVHLSRASGQSDFSEKLWTKYRRYRSKHVLISTAKLLHRSASIRQKLT